MKFPETASDIDERAGMVKDFAFPEGVHLRKI